VVVDDEHYQLKVINKPLIEQTRLTRISKKLERLGHEPTLVYRAPADLAAGLESASLRRARIVETSKYMDLFYGQDT